MDAISACALVRAKLCFLGSSCIYPVLDRPIKESDLMTGPLEPTNRAYAIAKIAGIEMCRAYATQYGLRCVILMPCNLYGPGRWSQDTHVINMLMKRMHAAKESGEKSIEIWGDGTPLREFMHVDDLAEACVHFMNADLEPAQILNVGTGQEVTIQELANMLRLIIYPSLELRFTGHLNGAPRKLLDSSLARSLGWAPKRELPLSLAHLYGEFTLYTRSAASPQSRHTCRGHQP